jgi:hypothetical protein
VDRVLALPDGDLDRRPADRREVAAIDAHLGAGGRAPDRDDGDVLAERLELRFGLAALARFEVLVAEVLGDVRERFGVAAELLEGDPRVVDDVAAPSSSARARRAPRSVIARARARLPCSKKTRASALSSARACAGACAATKIAATKHQTCP